MPHPGFIAGCEDLDVLGVVFYLMEEIDGFNPGSEVSEAYIRDETLRHDVGPSYAASLARLGNAEWEGKPLAELKRPGSFVERQVPQFLRLLESYRHERYDPESLAVTDLAEWLQANLPPDSEPGIMHGDPHLSNVLLRRDRPELAAFVDWEMCTIGDPLLDLGWMLITWPLNTSLITAGGALAAHGGLASRRGTPRGLLERRRARDDETRLVHGDGVLQTRCRHRGHLVALPDGQGESGRGRGVARKRPEPDRCRHPGSQGRQPI